MLCNKSDCTGCFACYNICPNSAIEMIEDNNGFIYPKINKEKCTNCNLCTKICPVNKKVEKKEPKECYAIYSKNAETRKTSTSGGLATTLSQLFLDNNGIVYGASYVENCEVNHIRVTNKEDLKKLQGSKYVQSYILNTYKQVKNDLLSDMAVLFFGTPCQIAGLKNYLIKDYDKLITIDIICHGVPSQKYLKDEVLRLFGNTDVDRVNFRNGNDYGFFIVKNSKVVYGVEKIKSPFCDAFMQTLNLRENCYNCEYANKNRVSDLTIGDFWGLSKESEFFIDRENGVSVAIISTDKGQVFFDKYKDAFIYEKRQYNEAVNGNTQLRIPAPKNKNYNKFKLDYVKFGFKKAYDKNTKILKLRRKLSKIKKSIKNIIKK